jgi:hypothetical protein
MRTQEGGFLMSITRSAVFVVALLALVAATPAAQAGGKRKGLRAEIATLKARIAQLESRVDFQARRGDAVVPGFPAGGLCADPCATDSDADGVGDCEDFCPCDATNADTDGDRIPDCADPCPDDATDACIDPCRMDSDADGTADCEDPCPWSGPETGDGDADGVPDCVDPCPEDKANDCSPVCALDADRDGQKDCTDPCPWGETMGAPCVLPPTGMALRRAR